MELDDNSGQIMQAVREAGIAENTLVVWTTDNGAWVDAWPDAGYTPFRWYERDFVRGRVPYSRDGMVAGTHKARNRG